MNKKRQTSRKTPETMRFSKENLIVLRKRGFWSFLANILATHREISLKNYLEDEHVRAI